MELLASIKCYDWGKLGNKSYVAGLAAANNKQFKLNEKQPYAELWMGAHPSGPSILKSSGKELSTILKNDLTFLFKVLSVRKALSIQVHPNKSQAEELHRKRPDLYQDSNHKPELAIALTPFTALCGFRPYGEILELCYELLPLKDLIGEENVNQLQCGCPSDLKRCYENVLTADESEIRACIRKIASNYTKALARRDLLDIFKTVNADFPNDVGVLSIFFMNVVKLQPGEALFLGANEIHSYLSGDCIECMACSDNVIRAGLTPKHKDIPQLLSSLNYEGKSAADQIFKPLVLNMQLRIFIPPVDDFAVSEITLPTSSCSYSFQISTTGSILLVLRGKRVLHLRGFENIPVQKGSIIYIPPEAAPQMELLPLDFNEDFLAYLATQNLDLKKT